MRTDYECKICDNLGYYVSNFLSEEGGGFEWFYCECIHGKNLVASFGADNYLITEIEDLKE